MWTESLLIGIKVLCNIKITFKNLALQMLEMVLKC